jgi:hypothetical protein
VLKNDCPLYRHFNRIKFRGLDGQTLHIELVCFASPIQADKFGYNQNTKDATAPKTSFMINSVFIIE